MEKISIALEKRVSVGVLELALRSMLDGNATSSYFHELANVECTGQNRAKKIVAAINRLVVKNRLAPFLFEHKTEVAQSLRNQKDRPLIFVAMMCSAYSVFYDTISICGKYFHVQEDITRDFLIKKLAEKYGSNRALDVAFDCIVPMLMEAGFIIRPRLGVYQIVRQKHYSDFSYSVYKQSFLLNNSNLTCTDDFESDPFFEFL